MVIEGGLSPSYVLDEMQMYEIQPLITNIYLKSKESWEQTRLLGYIIAQGNSTKTLKLNDIIRFPWDDDDEVNNTSISNEEIKNEWNRLCS